LVNKNVLSCLLKDGKEVNDDDDDDAKRCEKRRVAGGTSLLTTTIHVVLLARSHSSPFIRSRSCRTAIMNARRRYSAVAKASGDYH